MLLLEEKAYRSLPENKRELYVLQWLQNLPQAIRGTPRAELKAKQTVLVGQLLSQLQASLGPPLRASLGRAFVALYEVGDPFSLHDSVGKCCDILKAKEDSGSTVNKLAAVECLGSIFEHHGRMAGSSFPETVQVLAKAMKTQELRSEILSAFRRLLMGLGLSSTSAHKELYKCMRNGLGDKTNAVRSAAAKCALELTQHSTFLYSQELDSFSNSCLRALEGSNYDVRCSVAKLLGTLVALTQKPLPKNMKGKLKLPSLEDALSILSNGFIRGASGFLKAGGPELLKGGSASREVRVGVTQTYVVFLSEMGGVWVEKHLSAIAKHVLDLLTHPKTIATHIDAVYSRKCVSFILRSVFGKLLGESAQLVAARHLCQLICQSVTGVSALQRSEDGEKPGEGEKEKGKVVLQHMVICSVLEIGALLYSLNTAALPLVVGDSGAIVVPPDPQRDQRKQPPLLAALNCILVYPTLAARLAGAWCMHCIGLALPSQLSALVDYCLCQLKGSRTSLEAVSGYSHAIAALLATVRYSELGVPSSKAKEVFTLAQELITAGQDRETEKLALTNISSGWALIGAYISLGPTHVRSQLHPLLALWRSTFPRSMRELNAEQSGGTLASWVAALETRAGALSAIHSFLKFCGDLLTPDLTRRLMLPLDSALAMLQGLPALAKTHGVQLKASGATLRLRLYQALPLMPPSAYEGSLSVLLRQLVTEFTLTDNLANTTTSLLRSMCHHDDSILLGSWLEETDHREVEEQLQLNSAAGSGSLEHDPTSVFMTDTEVPVDPLDPMISAAIKGYLTGCSQKGTTLPGPLPLGVAVIDTSIVLFGRTFPSVAGKHRHQLLSHFRECVRQAKGARQQAIQINIFTAFLAALKNLVETKSVLGQQELLTSAYGLIVGALASSEPMLRCAAGEALGRMSQVGGDANFVAKIAQASFDTLKSTRDTVTRTGHSLVLGCLHRYVGGMGSGQHLQTSVSILQALTQDTVAPVVQVWALHALALIADSGGPMFRNYVEPTLTLMLSLLVSTPTTSVEVHQCLGKCLSALITTLGPELQDASQAMNATRKTCLTCCTIVQDHPDAIVQSAAIACLQQLRLFAPQYASLASIVPRLCENLNSSHLLLRRASANCLRQFTQQEPKTVWSITKATSGEGDEQGVGLEHIVLKKLDTESDPKLREDLREVLFSLLTSLAPEDPMRWLLLCNGVLSASGQNPPAGAGDLPPVTSETAPEGEEEDDVAKFTSGEEAPVATKITPRWPTRVFAVECSRKIYAVCKSDPAHFDLTLAQKQKREKGGDYLVMHLSELVRTSFIAATASVDQLKMAGYQALRDVIKLFAATPDPDFQGHVLLEQYQAQIGAALRPAFTPDTAPHVTAMACQVCSEWLGSGVSRDVGDLRRVQQLLVSSLEKLKKERQQVSLYGDAMATMESLAVLKAWAEMYIKVSDDTTREQGEGQGEEFLEDVDSQATATELLDPHLPSLSQYWLAALKDHAYLALPSQFSSQLPPSGGTFYSNNVMESVKPYYEANWPSLLHAAAIWLDSKGFESGGKSLTPSLPLHTGGNLLSGPAAPFNGSQIDVRLDHFHLILGLAVQSLCTPATLDQPLTVLNCLKALQQLLHSKFARREVSSDSQLAIDFLSVVHRMLLTCQSQRMHVLAVDIATLVGGALLDSATGAGSGGSQEQGSNGFSLEGDVEPGKSCVYALLEVSGCCLLRLIPALKPKEAQPSSSVTSKQPGLPSADELSLISQAVAILVVASRLCAPQACIQVLPPVLHMLLSALSHSSSLRPQPFPTTSSILQSLKLLSASLPLSDDQRGPRLVRILQSALASVLGVGEPDVSEAESSLASMDTETRLLATAILLSIPATICPPSSSLFDGCVRLFQQCLESGNMKLQLKALQTCRVLFAGQPAGGTSAHFIHALGPEVVRVVEGGVRSEAAVVVEATQVLEGLLDLAPEENKSKMMALLVPLFVSSLADSSSTVSQQQRVIHDHVLQRLMQIGPKYPVAFKLTMQGEPAIKQRLEGAIRASQTPTKGAGVARGPARVAGLRAQPSASSIKLKMDFSNFK